MIEYLRGPLARLSPTQAVIDCAGVGYLAEISLNTYEALQPGGAPAKDATLLIHEIIREDTHLLFGFATERERSLFRLLLGVSGVGANTARTILSALAPASLEQAIVQSDVTTMKSIKGIGAKTAERIIVDLRDKIKAGDSALSLGGAKPASAAMEEALAALVMLGFQKQPAEKALKAIFKENPALDAEKAIKKALSMM